MQQAISNTSSLDRTVPCVLDIGLSLGPGGLHWTLALARIIPVWLPGAHWSIIEDPEYFARDTRLVGRLSGLGSNSSPSANSRAREAFAAVVQEWREAREHLGLETREAVYWYHSGREGSVLPKDGDTCVVDRIEALAAGGDGRRNAGAAPDAISDGARDAVALAAALAAPHPFILAPLYPGEREPEAARYLTSIGIDCPQISEPGMLSMFRGPLLLAIARSGLAVPVASRRMRIAFVAVAVPRVGSIALRRAEDFSWRPGVDEDETALWEDASAIWWEVP
jgi:hypothetical protein